MGTHYKPSQTGCWLAFRLPWALEPEAGMRSQGLSLLRIGWALVLLLLSLSGDTWGAWGGSREALPYTTSPKGLVVAWRSPNFSPALGQGSLPQFPCMLFLSCT